MSGLQSVLEPSHKRETISKQPLSNGKTQQKDPADVQRQQKHYKKNNFGRKLERQTWERRQTISDHDMPLCRMLSATELHAHSNLPRSTLGKGLNVHRNGNASSTPIKRPRMKTTF